MDISSPHAESGPVEPEAESGSLFYLAPYSKVLNRTNCPFLASTGPDWAWVDKIFIYVNEIFNLVNERIALTGPDPK